MPHPDTRRLHSPPSATPRWPSAPHELRMPTIAIAKTCNHCAEHVRGLNHKAARCAQCDYTCHAHCHIKVEPTCPGPNPDARSGFLALFGAKQAGRRKSQRTGSAASGDTQASRDSTQPQSCSGTVARSWSQDHGSMAPAASHPTMALLVPTMASPATQPPGPYGTTAATDGATIPVLYNFEGNGAAMLSVHAGDRARIIVPKADGSGWAEIATVGAGGGW
ncbi:Protein BZZ1 [Coemansia spiralis]|nr:Protein BZZ1 [Coemansia spiralis]